MHVPSSDSKAAQGKHPVPQPQRLLLDAAAGALSGAISRFLVGPLDVVKIRFQVQLEPIALRSGKAPSHYQGFLHAFRTIVAEEGIKGLWMGTVPGMLLTVPYTAVQFVALHQCKQAAADLGWEGKSRTVVSFTSGAVAGAAATMASYPFDLLRTTLAAQGEPKVYRGMFHAASAIYQQQGLAGLYRGLGVTLIEIIPYAALQFGLYDVFNQSWDAAAARSRQRRQEQQQLWQGSGSSSSSSSSGSFSSSSVLDNKRLQAFTCGLAAGLLAKLGSHPLDVAKKRYQVAGLPRSLRYGERVQPGLVVTPLVSCLADIHAREGMAGLWKGSVPSIIKAAPAAAITFTAYEALIGLLLGWQQQAAVQRAAAAAGDGSSQPGGSG